MKVTQNQDMSGSGLQGLKNDMVASLKRRYPIIEGNLTLACATLLDPRFKEFPFQNKDLMQEAKDKIVREMEEGEGNISLPSESPEEEPTCTDANKKQGFWARYSEVFQPSSSSTHQPTPMGTTEELTQYLREQLLDPKLADKLGTYWFSSPHSRLRRLAMKCCVYLFPQFLARDFSVHLDTFVRQSEIV